MNWKYSGNIIRKSLIICSILGQASENMNDPERAIAAYESALRHNPYSEQTLTLVATLCRSVEKYSKASL